MCVYTFLDLLRKRTRTSSKVAGTIRSKPDDEEENGIDDEDFKEEHNTEEGNVESGPGDSESEQSLDSVGEDKAGVNYCDIFQSSGIVPLPSISINCQESQLDAINVFLLPKCLIQISNSK